MSLSGSRVGHPWRMVVTLHTRSLRTLDQVCAFLDGKAAVAFVAPAGAERLR